MLRVVYMAETNEPLISNEVNISWCIIALCVCKYCIKPNKRTFMNYVLYLQLLVRR